MQTEKLSILPPPQDNIYPLINENVEALLKFYFMKVGIFGTRDVSFLMDSGLQINQIEFIAKKVIENFSFFKKELDYGGMHIDNLMKYGLDAFLEDFSKFDMAWNRNKITVGFFNLISNNKD